MLFCTCSTSRDSSAPRYLKATINLVGRNFRHSSRKESLLVFSLWFFSLFFFIWGHTTKTSEYIRGRGNHSTHVHKEETYIYIYKEVYTLCIRSVCFTSFVIARRRNGRSSLIASDKRTHHATRNTVIIFSFLISYFFFLYVAIYSYELLITLYMNCFFQFNLSYISF